MTAVDLDCSKSDLASAIASGRVLLSGATSEVRLSVARHVHAAADRERTPFVMLGTSRLQPRPPSGTLFLAEIGDLRPWQQAELLKWLEEWSTTCPSGVRIISATAYADALDVVRLHRLDPTLFYRLNIVHIKLHQHSDRQFAGGSDLPVLDAITIGPARPH